jgi:NTE family protein
MKHTPSSLPHERALVLGGGGSTGNAWLIGVITGMLDAGLDVTDADLIVGTSAGATAAAQITSAPLAELYTATAEAVALAPTRPLHAGGSSRASGHVNQHLDRMRKLIDDSHDAADLRHRVGESVLASSTQPDASAHWRGVVSTRLPEPLWPHREILITTLNARTGEPAVFGRHSGVELVDAVAASCSSSFAYYIGDTPYIDGGYRNGPENADLASGYRRVLILAPFSGRALTPSAWGMNMSTQVDDLRAQGSRVETVDPGASNDHLFGANAMNPGLRPAAARAGYERGSTLAHQLREFWH